MFPGRREGPYGRPMTRLTRGTGRDRVVARATALLLLGLLAGCTAGDGDSGSAEDRAAGLSEAAPDAVGDAAAGTAAGGDAAAAQAEAGLRQQIVRAEVQVSVPDPTAATDDVIALVTAVGGRVDARDELRGVDGDESSARLVLRVPADELDDVIDALADIGDVERVQQTSDDVTTTAQDLDARIRATEISVARMQELLAGATTTSDLLEVESALSERQASLESMEAERAGLAEQVALSTLTLSLTTPDDAAAQADGPDGFLGGLAAGWDALVAVLRGTLVVVGALLPWAVLAGAVLAAGLLARRVLRRRRRPGVTGR